MSQQLKKRKKQKKEEAATATAAAVEGRSSGCGTLTEFCFSSHSICVNFEREEFVKFSDTTRKLNMTDNCK